MIYTAEQLADHLTARGADVRHDPNVAGHAWVRATHNGHSVLAIFHESPEIPTAHGPGSGRFYTGRSWVGPNGAEWQPCTTLKSLVDFLDLPVPATTMLAAAN